MKRLLVVVLVLAMAFPSYAVDGKALLVGFGIGVAVQIVPWTRNHIVMPPIQAVQRATKMTPEDRARRKAEKAKRKAEKK